MLKGYAKGIGLRQEFDLQRIAQRPLDSGIEQIEFRIASLAFSHRLVKGLDETADQGVFENLKVGLNRERGRADFAPIFEKLTICPLI